MILFLSTFYNVRGTICPVRDFLRTSVVHWWFINQFAQHIYIYKPNNIPEIKNWTYQIKNAMWWPHFTIFNISCAIVTILKIIDKNSKMIPPS